jgi:uncharacterized protein YndB with AHSA1/START domain
MKQEITIEATINAGTKKVWEYWTAPEHITQWNFASDEWHCPKAQNDLVVGGQYIARMEAKDGSFGFDFEGTYDEIVDQKRMSYTLGDGRKVVTEFTDLDGSTTVTTTFESDGTHSVEMQRAGWQSILDNFKKHVEGN